MRLKVGRPLVAASPHVAHDVDDTMRVLGRLADEDGIPLHVPSVWQPEHPWA